MVTQRTELQPNQPPLEAESAPLLPGMERVIDPLTERLKDPATPILADLLIDFFEHQHSENQDDQL